MALLDESLAEREPHPRLYAGLLKLLEAMLADPRWLETYVRFELCSWGIWASRSTSSGLAAVTGAAG